MAIPLQVVFDCADPPVVARFWADALGYQLQGPPEPTAEWLAFQDEQGIPEERWNDASAIIDPEGSGPRIFFPRVPEPKAVKNRLHLDINAGGPPGTPPAERRDESMRRSDGWPHPVLPSCARTRSMASTASRCSTQRATSSTFSENCGELGAAGSLASWPEAMIA